jgi:hypothetical protein
LILEARNVDVDEDDDGRVGEGRSAIVLLVMTTNEPFALDFIVLDVRSASQIYR